MTSLFIAKLLNGKEARFLRFKDADGFVVEVDGEERVLSREAWRLLPDKKPSEQDQVPATSLENSNI